MKHSLPRTYWCHAEEVVPGAVDVPLSNATTTAPGQAVHWVRESVRSIAPALDRSAFYAVWEWLGNHPAVDAAVIALRQGKPYVYTVATPGGGLLRWTAYPVSVLPLVGPGCLPAAPLPRTVAPPPSAAAQALGLDAHPSWSIA
ncbi:hypothetical protein ACH41E_30430 [Streptomyces sp. NPDC020412]|uniref:hypothetical protein n=1 Tax=Streptomyces sp. NPDC020412 TaxID=3365073 RepID=UPI0037A464AE